MEPSRRTAEAMPAFTFNPLYGPVHSSPDQRGWGVRLMRAFAQIKDSKTSRKFSFWLKESRTGRVKAVTELLNFFLGIPPGLGALYVSRRRGIDWLGEVAGRGTAAAIRFFLGYSKKHRGGHLRLLASGLAVVKV